MEVTTICVKMSKTVPELAYAQEMKNLKLNGTAGSGSSDQALQDVALMLEPRDHLILETVESHLTSRAVHLSGEKPVFQVEFSNSRSA